MDWNEALVSSLEILMPLFILVIGAGLGLAVAYLRKLTAQIKNEDARAIADNALDRAHLYTLEAVKGTAQVYTDEIRKGREDGKLTPEEQAKAREMAFDFFRTFMGQKGLQLLEETVGDVRTWFEKALEPAVRRLKAETGTGTE